MPLAAKPTCTECQATSANIWKKKPDGEIVCNTCFSAKPAAGTSGSAGSQFIGPIRKSARLKPSKYKTHLSVKPIPTRGRGRRIIFKKNPIKAPSSVATVVTSNHIFHEGQYWQKGDIASVMDHDGGIFFVQLRGFLQDQYCEKSGVLTWLLPTTASPHDRFDPSTYILGPEEDLPRTMDCFEFICHAPSEYFKSKTSPFPTRSLTPEIGFIATSIGSPVISKVPTSDEMNLMDERLNPGTGRKERRKEEKKDMKKERKKPAVKGKI
ncbi:hypothetical protein CAPTEDRAFT_169638 [Capitella teleta]|uniref:GATA zinc finger domain-containing protein 1 n=1 Tax=Capitella teleta TaxID=283909 RepID=R7USV7_CAPTE|nr:hypothetical protein CAPTEDRAFT_169638 [Capitella teleta]|eukprot:ELU06486.1 hypothetical protein CAPTEDRAFT_169638 [Capitella teleta]